MPKLINKKLADFFCLKLNMNYNEVLSKVGRATRITGSGIPTYAYDLDDGSSILLSFGVNENKLKSALITQKDGSAKSLFEVAKNSVQIKL